VIDDEADYFSTDSNQWLSTEDREMLRKREEELRSKRFASRKDRKITLDFAGRQVIEENPSKTVNMYDVNDDVVQKVNFGARSKDRGGQVDRGDGTDPYIVNPNIKVEAPKVCYSVILGSVVRNYSFTDIRPKGLQKCSIHIIFKVKQYYCG